MIPLPYLLLAVIAGSGVLGFAGGWKWQDGRVARAEAARDELSAGVATRDTTITELLRSSRSLTAAAETCAASVAVLAEQGARTEQEATRALQAVRTGQESTRAAIGALAGRIQAGGVSCEAAAAEVRGLLR